MPNRNESLQSERVLVCAPFGRDAALIQRELQAAGLTAEVCSSVDELSAKMGQHGGAALIADEALGYAALGRLTTELAKAPPWSDFPILVMTSGGDRTEGSRCRLRLLEPLGNVSLLERPLRTATLVSSVRAALRARRHQYQIAELLRNAEISQEEIERRNQELIKLNRQLEEFAYVASHDLQEPLRMVNIYTELLTRHFGSHDPKAQDYAGFIHRGVSQMAELLRDLLTFSRTIHPDGTSEGAADLSNSFSQAVSMLNGRIDECAADIRCGNLPTVAGDEGQFTQVFQNLLSNALKYRKPELRPEIDVSASWDGGQWLIAMRDNGIGFDPKYSERIFGLFKRLHKEAYPGTGLGLAICQRIVERYGGRIWAESKPGEGATFYCSLKPAATREDAP